MDVDEESDLLSNEGEKTNADIYDNIKSEISDEKEQKCVPSSIPQMPAQYLPSFNSGFCGHYNYTVNKQQSKQYLPSLNSGIFGTWIYSENASLKTKAQILYEQSFLATGKQFRKIHRDIEHTVNGYRFNVELISEWKIPISNNKNTNSNISEKSSKTNLKKMVKTAKKKLTTCAVLCMQSNNKIIQKLFRFRNILHFQWKLCNIHWRMHCKCSQ